MYTVVKKKFSISIVGILCSYLHLQYSHFIRFVRHLEVVALACCAALEETLFVLLQRIHSILLRFDVTLLIFYFDYRHLILLVMLLLF